MRASSQATHTRRRSASGRKLLACAGFALFLALVIRFVLLVLAQDAWAQEGANDVLSEPASDTSQDSPPSLLPFNDTWTGDLDGMRRRGRIRILVPYSKTFYFIDIGDKQFGGTYEIGRAFEDWLNKEDKAKTLRTSVVFIPVSRDRLLPGLLDGTGDIAAGNLTITEERMKAVEFAHPLAKGVREILVTGPAAPAVASLDDLGGKGVLVRTSSSYFEHMDVIRRNGG